MPVRKISEFREQMKNGNACLTCDEIDDMSANYVELKPGDEVKPHTHERTECYLFLTGRAQVMTGEDITEVTTGDVAIAPRGTVHAIRVIGGEVLRFFAFNAPPAARAPMVTAPEEYLWKWKRG